MNNRLNGVNNMSRFEKLNERQIKYGFFPSAKYVIHAVINRQVTSNVIFTFEYGLFIISDKSLGNRSVGIIGSLHRLDNAIPKQMIM